MIVRLKRLPSLMQRALHESRVSRRTSPLHTQASTISGCSTSSSRWSCQGSFVDSCDQCMLTAIRKLSLQGKLEDITSWPEVSGKAALRVASFFSLEFDPIFRWLHDSIIPRNPAAPHFLQTSPCASADDFCSGFVFLAALSPAFVVVDRVARLESEVLLCALSVHGYLGSTSALENPRGSPRVALHHCWSLGIKSF